MITFTPNFKIPESVPHHIDLKDKDAAVFKLANVLALMEIMTNGLKGVLYYHSEKDKAMIVTLCEFYINHKLKPEIEMYQKMEEKD